MLAVGKIKRGKGTKIMAITDAAGLPAAVHVESASPHEVWLVEDTIDSSFTEYAPDKLVAIGLKTAISLTLNNLKKRVAA